MRRQAKTERRWGRGLCRAGAPGALVAAVLVLASCGSSGSSSSTATQGTSAAPAAKSRAARRGAAAAGGAAAKPRHLHHNPACRKPSYCTPASSAAATFWPSRRQPQRRSNGSVAYTPPPGQAPPPLPGEMALASPAFAINEPLPAAYTCDGAGISPPLQWRNVPKKAAALVLLVIDTSSGGRSGGIRWMVADIDPHSGGVAAGQTPAGGVVGSNAAGKAAYGPVCPAHGKESWVEFQLYALSKPIALPSGFQPAQAESRYGPLILGKGAATTYAVYVRP